MRPTIATTSMDGDRRCEVATISQEPSVHVMKRFEYKVIDTGKGIEEQLNELGAAGWQVVGVTKRCPTRFAGAVES